MNNPGCQHKMSNDFCDMCEYNDKPCVGEDECEEYQGELAAEEAEIKANDFD